jgi:hypothetical protein
MKMTYYRSRIGARDDRKFGASLGDYERMKDEG